MENRYDVITIGAGANGLTAAAMLAKAGRKVLVLERRKIVGGLCAGEEFARGYRTPGVFNSTAGMRRSVSDKLELEKHGLRFCAEAPSVLVAQRKDKGPGVLIHRDPAKMAKELGDEDRKSYAEYRAFLNRIKPIVKGVFDESPPDLEKKNPAELLRLGKLALALRMLGKKDMMEVLRIGPMCVADWLNEYFRSDLLKAGLCWPALEASFTGPWSPGTNANLILRECMEELPVAGGAQALAKALEAAAKAQGVEIRTGAEVQRILVKGGRASGVKLEDGQEISADTIASSCDPRTTFLNLIEGKHIPFQVEQRISNFRARGTSAKLHLALKTPLRFACRPDHKVEYAFTGQDVNQIEKSFDAVKYSRFSDWPILDIYVPSESAPSLAPSGGSVVSISVHYVPYKLSGGWSDQRKDDLGARVMEVLEDLAPGVSDTVVGGEVLSPHDIEQRYNTSEGHLYHGEHALDQLLVRPIPECARYHTPIEGLFLCGSGSHPGGGVTCAPGSLAATAIVAKQGKKPAVARQPAKSVEPEARLEKAKTLA